MTTRIGFAQTRPEFGRTDANLAEIERLAAVAGADLLVLPELAASGYEFADRDEALALAEPFGDGPISVATARIAETHRVTLVVGYPERDGARLYNSCLLASPDGRLANYRKLHLFDRELALFDPGDRAPEVVETPAGRVGMMICFDWVFPEVARALALAGAQVIAHACNLVMPYCQRAMFARSVENRVFTVTANRVGAEERAGRRIEFTGASQVLDPCGNTLASASTGDEAVCVVEVDLSAADDKWISPRNHIFESRRPGMYGDVIAPKS